MLRPLAPPGQCALSWPAGPPCLARGIRELEGRGRECSCGTPVTHRGARRAGGALAAFQSECSLWKTRLRSGAPRGRPQGRAVSARTTAPLPRPLTHHWTGEPSVPRKATQSRRAILPGEAGGARVSLKSEPWVSLGAGQRQGAGLGRVWRRVCNAPESFGATWAAATHVCPLRGLGLLVRLLRERGHGQGVGSIAPSEHTPSWRHVKL